MDDPDTMALLADLLRSEMGFPTDPKDPRVVIYNTNWDVPNTSHLYVVLGVLSDDEFGGGLSYVNDPVTGVLNSQQVLERNTTYTVDLVSVTDEARRRRQEVFFSLQGDAAERLSGTYSFRIFRPTPFIDLSQIEASRRLNRWQTQFQVYQGFAQTKAVPSMFPRGLKSEIQP